MVMRATKIETVTVETAAVSRPVAPGVAAVGLLRIGVEDLLVWTYRDQRADWLCGRGAALYEGERAASHQPWAQASRDGCAAVAQLAELGVRVDSSPAMGARRAEVHGDAEAVHELVQALPDREIAGLVIACARSGSRPDWRPDARWRLVPLSWKQRGVVAEGETDWMSDGAAGRGCRYTPVIEMDAPEAVEAARLIYGRWQATLQLLMATLRRHARCLTQHAVSEALPPAAPWRDDFY